MIPLRLVARYFRHRKSHPRPFEIEAALLNTCNLKCQYCNCRHVKKGELTTEQWRSVIRSVATLGAMRFKLHGGEPTLRPDFSNLAAEIRANHMICATVTNGTIIADRPELLDHLDEVIVSLDSHTAELHDRVRGAGSHRKAVRAIDLAVARDIRTCANMVVTRENMAHVGSMLDFCEDRGIAINVQPIAFGGVYYNGQARALELTDEEIRALHRRLIEWKRQGRPLVFSRLAYEKVLKWPDFNVLTVPRTDKKPCVAGTEYIRLEANGDALPCCQYGGEFTPKNTIADGVVEALRHARHHSCGDCWLAYYNERNALFRLKLPAVLQVLRGNR